MKRIMFFLFVVSFGCARQPELIRYYPVPEFSLVERAARPSPVTIWPAKYGSQTYLHECAAPVPMMSEEMRKLQDVLPPEIAWFPLQSNPRGIQRGAREIRAEVRGR